LFPRTCIDGDSDERYSRRCVQGVQKGVLGLFRTARLAQGMGLQRGGVKWKEPMEEYRVLREKRLCEECGKMAWGRFMKMVVSLAKEVLTAYENPTKSKEIG